MAWQKPRSANSNRLPAEIARDRRGRRKSRDGNPATPRPAPKSPPGNSSSSAVKAQNCSQTVDRKAATATPVKSGATSTWGLRPYFLLPNPFACSQIPSPLRPSTGHSLCMTPFASPDRSTKEDMMAVASWRTRKAGQRSSLFRATPSTAPSRFSEHHRGRRQTVAPPHSCSTAKFLFSTARACPVSSVYKIWEAGESRVRGL